MKTIAITLFTALLAPSALGGTVLFAENTNRTRHEVMYEIFVSDDREGFLDFDVSVADDSPNNADIVALYFSFNVHNAERGYRSSDFTSESITDIEFNTRRVQSGNIGRHFDFGLAIGTPGAGHDFYDSFSFSMNVRNGLSLDDLMLFGVRGTSVGYESSHHHHHSGSGSAKTFVGYTGPVSLPNAIPLPSGAALTLAGLGFVTGTRRRQSV